MKKEKGKRVISAAVVLASVSSSKKKDLIVVQDYLKAERQRLPRKSGSKPLAVVATAGAISKCQCSAMDFPDEKVSNFVVDRSVRKASSIAIKSGFQERIA